MLFVLDIPPCNTEATRLTRTSTTFPKDCCTAALPVSSKDHTATAAMGDLPVEMCGRVCHSVPAASVSDPPPRSLSRPKHLTQHIAPHPPDACARFRGSVCPSRFEFNGKTSLYRRRVAELKHGRVCMLATVGVLVQSFVQFPDPDRSAFSNTRPLGALFQVLPDAGM